MLPLCHTLLFVQRLRAGVHIEFFCDFAFFVRVVCTAPLSWVPSIYVVLRSLDTVAPRVIHAHCGGHEVQGQIVLVLFGLVVAVVDVGTCVHAATMRSIASKIWVLLAGVCHATLRFCGSVRLYIGVLLGAHQSSQVDCGMSTLCTVLSSLACCFGLFSCFPCDLSPGLLWNSRAGHALGSTAVFQSKRQVVFRDCGTCTVRLAFRQNRRIKTQSQIIQFKSSPGKVGIHKFCRL